MKSIVILALLLLISASAGAYFHFIPSYSFNIPIVRVAVQLPDSDEAKPDTYFTTEENATLQSILRPYNNKIEKVKILLDHFHNPSLKENCASFQLIITTPEGCVLQSKETVISRYQLISAIKSKVTRSFELFDQLSRTQNFERREIARISEI